MAQIVTVQGKIAATGTPQIVTSYPLQFQSVTITAKTGNAAALVIVNNASASVAVDGTGAGYILSAGTSVTFTGILNTNEFYIAGTANDVFSLAGT